MDYDIISFLDFNPNDEIEILDITLENATKYIQVRKILTANYCPVCGQRMHSKGVYKRHINHPILQDGYRIVLILHQRKWKCTNPLCNYYCNDEFSFVEKGKQNTYATVYLILQEMKDLNITARYIAKKFNVSDTFVHDVFLQYIDCQRLPMPPILAIDEVLMNFNNKNRYTLVLMNFITGEIVDILPNRYKSDYEKYFLSIPLSERNNVKAIVCDMYNPYINFSVNYFHQAAVVIDSFHVIQWINHKINIYINNVKKKYQQKEQEKLQDKNFRNNKDYKTIKQSKEVYILNNYRWILLTPRHRINYSTQKKWNSFFNQYLCTYDYEKSFMALDSNFQLIRELRDRYIRFNEEFSKEFNDAAEQLDTLIAFYSQSTLLMFREFSELLKKYHIEICNSFKTIEHYSNEAYTSSLSETSSNLRRLSNGPMEGFNRKPKDLKRNSRGVENIRYTINRIIWSNRQNEPIRYTPKPLEEVKISTGVTRGPYKKF